MFLSWTEPNGKILKAQMLALQSNVCMFSHACVDFLQVVSSIAQTNAH